MRQCLLDIRMHYTFNNYEAFHKKNCSLIIINNVNFMFLSMDNVAENTM